MESDIGRPRGSFDRVQDSVDCIWGSFQCTYIYMYTYTMCIRILAYISVHMLYVQDNAAVDLFL